MRMIFQSRSVRVRLVPKSVSVVPYDKCVVLEENDMRRGENEDGEGDNRTQRRGTYREWRQFHSKYPHRTTSRRPSERIEYDHHENGETERDNAHLDQILNLIDRGEIEVRWMESLQVLDAPTPRMSTSKGDDPLKMR